MTTASDLLPELQAWNEGRGIGPLDYVFSVARPDVTVALVELFWPPFVEFEGYVLREGFDEEILRSWEARPGIKRENIEAAINFLDVGLLFANSKEAESALLDARMAFVRATLSETYTAKLARDFPDNHFEVVLIDDEDDFAISFFQIGSDFRFAQKP
jgi:hypothetical protein